jgi:hypothetical protein
MSCSTNASRSGGESVSHDEQRQTDRVGQQCLVLGIDPVHAVDDQIGKSPGERLLAA